MKTKIILFMMSAILFSSFKNDKPAYLIFNVDGKEIKYSRMIEYLKDADVILFGESHDNPISHWLELKVTKDLYAIKKQNLTLAAEMFETDNQLILDEYLDSLISQARFEEEAKIWPNYKTDYKPLVEFARKSNLRFIASNIPRRYASLVNVAGFEGLDKLNEGAKKYLPPLPVEYDAELNCYKSMMNMQGMGNHVTANFPKAQAVKDATMAYYMMNGWQPGNTVIHFNGSYHSDNYEGINWYLKKSNPALKIITITTVSQDDISELKKENSGIANFTICVDDEMTKTR